MAEETEEGKVVHSTYQGKDVTLTDKTGQVPDQELQDVLDRLIAEGHFGITGLSSAGSGAISLGEPQVAHIQIGENLYALFVSNYQATIDWH
jgi:hypothetical protein